MFVEIELCFLMDITVIRRANLLALPFTISKYIKEITESLFIGRIFLFIS